MEKSILIVLTVISIVSCNDFTILSSPKSIVFKGSSDLPSSAISEVFAASLGYSVYSTEPWDGLSVLDPFHTAKSVVSFVVEDANNLKFDNSKSFEITGNDFFFEDAITTKVLDHSHLAININLIDQEGDIETSIGEIEQSPLSEKNHILSSKDKANKEFLSQISYLQGMSDVLANMKTKPAFISVHLSMKSLSKKTSESEANKLLTTTLKKLNDVIQKAYDNEALVAVITVPSYPHHSRAKRAAEDDDISAKYNLADLASANYPVVFNIILWFSLVMVFALIAISLALGNVEDKDSIIYRMTGARGKKDN
jgi:renin receptor